MAKGLTALKERIAHWAKTYPGAAAAALYQEALAIDALAVQKCPVDTGRLRASHYVAPPTDDNGRIKIEIGFGTDYAVPVHERTEVAHRVGEAKFLEKALHERMPGFWQRLGKRILANVRAGVTVTSISAEVPTSPQFVHGPGRIEYRRSKSAAKRARKAARKAKKVAAAQLRRERKQKTRERKLLQKQKRAEKRAVNRKRRAAKKERDAVDRLRRRSQPKDFDF